MSERWIAAYPRSAPPSRLDRPGVEGSEWIKIDSTDPCYMPEVRVLGLRTEMRGRLVRHISCGEYGGPPEHEMWDWEFVRIYRPKAAQVDAR